jgi:hypothetical protein
MSVSQSERERRGELFDSLAKQRYEFELLSVSELAQVLRAIHPRLNELGRKSFIDVEELMYLQDPPEVTWAPSLEEAREATGRILETPGFVGYVTGALEMGPHHKMILEMVLDGLSLRTYWWMDTFVMGIEGEEYVREKGREPLFSLQEKISLWKRLAPDRSILFAVPPKPEVISANDYYDWIALYLGFFRHPKVYYFGSEDDSREIIEAHHHRAFSPSRVLHRSFGNPPIHTSDLLIE